MTVSLRPYQQQAVDDLRGAYADRFRAPLLVMPTGSGKTYTYSAIAEGAAKRGSKILILEHRKELLRQASCSLAALGVRHSVVAPSSKIADIRRTHVARFGKPMVDQQSHVAVASVQTLVRRLGWLVEFSPDLIVIDEGDLAIAGSWTKILAAVPDARALGVTASPCRADGIGMDQVYDRLVLGPSMRDLIEMGALCQPRVFAPPVDVDTSGVSRREGDLNPAQLAELYDNKKITGDAVAHYRQAAHCKPAIVFCASVKHAEHVAEQFRAAGYRFEVVTGNMMDDDRDDRIMGLASGKYHGIVTVDVVSRGTDIPVAEVAILLRKTESLALYLQQVGRVLRPAEGKEYGLVLDHAGNALIHGLPQSDRDWTLDGRKKGKRGSSDPEVKFLQCPKCYMVHEPAPICPVCQHVYDQRSTMPEHNDGQLIEITEDAAELARIAARKDQGRAQSAKQMVEQLGYSRGRAEKIVAARAEKERLQAEARSLLEQWSRLHGRSAEAEFCGGEPVARMKPKALKALIEEVGGGLFSGAANA